jgi:haloacetate dehalogenase
VYSSVEADPGQLCCSYTDTLRRVWRGGGLPQLSRTKFTVVTADLPGYGESTLSNAAIADGQLSKRTMARVVADAMDELGIAHYAVVGHDRGARVAYRLALDQPNCISALAVLDVIPILDMAERLTYDAARQRAHWFWVVQPSRVPETLIGRDPDLYVRNIIEQWGGSDVIEPEVIDEYVRCMRRPEVLRTMGAEYRADQLDLEHDSRSDRRSSNRLPAARSVGGGGLMEQFGDPLAIWRRWADQVDGGAPAGGHFMMEESPQALTALIRTFLNDSFVKRTVAQGSSRT